MEALGRLLRVNGRRLSAMAGTPTPCEIVEWDCGQRVDAAGTAQALDWAPIQPFPTAGRTRVTGE